MAPAKVVLWTVLAVILSAVSSADPSDQPHDDGVVALTSDSEASDLQDKERMLGDAVPLALAAATTLNKLSSYLARDAENVREAIDDVLFCIRLAKGQLAQLRSESPQVYAGGPVALLLEEAEENLSQAEQTLEGNFHLSPNFHMHFSFSRIPALAEKITRLDSKYTIPNFELIWELAYIINFLKAGSVTQFGPHTSDVCMSQLQPEALSGLGQALTGRASYCPLDAPCWLMTTKPGTEGYYLTHQLLFLLLGQNGGCGPDFEAQVRRYFGALLPAGVGAGAVVPEMMRYQCRGVLRDAHSIAGDGYPDQLKDLFLEQGFLCGAAVDMPEFFSPEWVRLAISWQKPSGCYGFPNPSRPLSRMADFSEGSEDVERNLEEDDGESDVDNMIDVGMPMPSPRVDEVMDGQCYAHFGAVTLGYFSVAMRYLVKQQC